MSTSGKVQIGQHWPLNTKHLLGKSPMFVWSTQHPSLLHVWTFLLFILRHLTFFVTYTHFSYMTYTPKKTNKKSLQKMCCDNTQNELTVTLQYYSYVIWWNQAGIITCINMHPWPARLPKQRTEKLKIHTHRGSLMPLLFSGCNYSSLHSK